MKVSEFQRHIAELYLEKDKRRGAEATLLWLIEEVGEMTEAARRKGLGDLGDAVDASADTSASSLDGLAAEMADVLAWTASLANLYGIDLETALARKYPPQCARCGRKPCACAEEIATRL